jgi:uncharacterized protein YoxC
MRSAIDAKEIRELEIKKHLYKSITSAGEGDLDVAKKHNLAAKQVILDTQKELALEKKVTGEKAKQLSLTKQGPTSSLTSLGRGTPLGLSGVEAFPQTKDLGMFGPKLSFMGQKTGFGSSPILGSKDLPGSPKSILDVAKQNAVPVRGSKDIFGSPAYYDAANKEALRIAKANAMPIKGFKSLPGSPAFHEEQAKRLKKLRGAPTGFSAAEFGPQQPMQGPAMGPTSMGLNFDKRTGKLLAGPAGSSPNTFRNLGRRFDTQSAMISGGFPLLFGQGPVTAAAGALGGGIGGMFGQMGGFAGGIAATALVQSINQALTAMSELGKAMGPFTQNSQALTDSLGLQGSAEEARIKLIEQSEGKTAAFNASMQLMTTRIGEDGVKNLEKFGETTRLLGSEMSLAITQLHALGAGIANFVLNITGLKEGLEASAATRSVADAAARGDTAAQGLVDRRKQIEAMGGQGGEGARKQAALDVLEAEEKIFAIRQNTIIQAEVMAGQFNSMVRSLEAEKEEAERLVELREEGLNPAIAKTIAALEKEASLAKTLIDAEIELLLAEQARTGELGEADQTRLTTLEAQKDKIDESVEGTTKLVKETENLNDAANETVDAFTQLRDTIAQDIGNGLKDLITGAKSLNEVLSNILANMANSFLNLGIFGNIGGTFKPGEGLLGRIFPKADGGPVKAGGKYVVGERGPELFSPTRSGMITPNHALGGTTSVNVNVDASGSSVEGDGSQAEQLGEAISQAIQAELIQQKRPGGILYS